MSDEKKTKAARALRALARRVQHGLTKLEPVSEQQLTKVRAAFRQQWAATHRDQAKTEVSQALSPARKTKQQQQGKSNSKDRSQDHGHSY